jgi:hypothetical protein
MSWNCPYCASAQDDSVKEHPYGLCKTCYFKPEVAKEYRKGNRITKQVENTDFWSGFLNLPSSQPYGPVAPTGQPSISNPFCGPGSCTPDPQPPSVGIGVFAKASSQYFKRPTPNLNMPTGSEKIRLVIRNHNGNDLSIYATSPQAQEAIKELIDKYNADPSAWSIIATPSDNKQEVEKNIKEAFFESAYPSSVKPGSSEFIEQLSTLPVATVNKSDLEASSPDTDIESLYRYF